jgi:hypothetical protein
LRKKSDHLSRVAGAAAQERAEDLELDALRERTREDLIALAKKLGLVGVSKLKKEALAVRVHEAAKGLRGSAAAGGAPREPKSAGGKPKRAGGTQKPEGGMSKRAATAPTPAGAAPRPAGAAPEPPAGTGATAMPGPEPAVTAKLDLGPDAGAAERPVQDIPWSYGRDRVTAMAVDPMLLFVYWEVTDPAITRAREQLHAGGPGAWLNVRVYDTSGLIFDGTNARSYFDHRVERHDRQWFFRVGKPTSTAYVDIGLRSTEGYFVRIARTGRVDFPRAEPVPAERPEWLTVRAATGEISHVGRGGPHVPRPLAPGRKPEPHVAVPVFEGGDDGEQVRVWQLLHGDGERIGWRQLLGGAGWLELERRDEWEGPVLFSSWEAGPFTYPVTVEPPSREEWEGRSFAYRVGDVTHVVYGPWQVVIRNLGAHHERGEIGRWEVFRSWVATTGREVRVSSQAGEPLRVGASEALGASERRWIAGSERRLGGASEVWRLGASEIRMRGASETLFVGASQWIKLGASERRLLGASERRLLGASERRLLGASEIRLAGGSERRLGGASEQRLGGASETRLVGGSEHRLDVGPNAEARPTDVSAPLPYPDPGG